jgi:hypothetical protein
LTTDAADIRRAANLLADLGPLVADALQLAAQPDLSEEGRRMVAAAWAIADAGFAALAGQPPIGHAEGALFAVARRGAALCAAALRGLDAIPAEAGDDDLRVRLAGFHDALRRMVGDLPARSAAN